jgi:hypothetical protein
MKKTLKDYRVTGTLMHPSYGSHGSNSGFEFMIRAYNKAEAIKEARAKVRRECLFDRHDGPINYTAEQVG